MQIFVRMGFADREETHSMNAGTVQTCSPPETLHHSSFSVFPTILYSRDPFQLMSKPWLRLFIDLPGIVFRKITVKL